MNEQRTTQNDDNDGRSRGHTVEITVLYFAQASTATGKTCETLALPSTYSDPESQGCSGDGAGFPLSSLREVLERRYADTGLSEVLDASSWSVNAEMVDEEDVREFWLRGGDEVAVICPVAGG